MKKGSKLRPEQEFVWKVLLIIGEAIKTVVNKIFSFTKKNIFKAIGRNIIVYGMLKGQEIWDFATNRNSHTIIKGQPGFGKSALVANIAIQNIEQKTRILFIDPHGDPEAVEKGASVNIYERANDVSRVTFLSVNQKNKVIGYNPLFVLGKKTKLDQLKDKLMRALIYDTKESINKGHEVAIAASFLLESVIYFHNAYFERLLKYKGKTKAQKKEILESRQITINDLATLLDNPELVNLFITVLGDKNNKYYRPNLVKKWQLIKERKKIDTGMKGVVGRLHKIVTTAEAKWFFESNGFNLVEELKHNKSVLCDISNFSEFTTAVISKLILVGVYDLHKKSILKTQTEFYIDEAANIEMHDTAEIIDQGRKKKLSLTLICQYIKQFSNPKTINSIIYSVVTKIDFRNSEASSEASREKTENLKKRHFNIKNSHGYFEDVRTADMPKIKRKLQFEERGVAREVLERRVHKKEEDIFSYFLKL